MKNFKNKKGITLVALIITIIVLLILAVVAISTVTGDGIISKAKLARENYQTAQETENTALGNYWLELDKINNKEETFVGKYYIELDNEGGIEVLFFDDEGNFRWYGTDSIDNYEKDNNGNFITCNLEIYDAYNNEGIINKNDEKFKSTCIENNVDITKVANNIIISEKNNSGYYSYYFFNLDYSKVYNITTISTEIEFTGEAIYDNVLIDAVENALPYVNNDK